MKLLLILSTFVFFYSCSIFYPERTKQLDIIDKMIKNPNKISEIYENSDYYDILDSGNTFYNGYNEVVFNRKLEFIKKHFPDGMLYIDKIYDETITFATDRYDSNDKELTCQRTTYYIRSTLDSSLVRFKFSTCECDDSCWHLLYFTVVNPEKGSYR
jgi:hypothetical protein